jgi:hypothetical protein
MAAGGAGLSGCQLFFDFARKPFIIVVQQRDPLTPGCSYSNIACLSATDRVFERDYSQPWVRNCL